MDAGTVDLLRLGQVTLSEIPRSGEYATTNDILTKLEDLVPDLKRESELNKNRIEIFRQLQTAAASAISARIEIEKTILPQVTGTREEDGLQVQTETITEDRDQESDLNERSMAVDDELSRQLEDAEGEIKQLRKQLMALLDREMEARNQLRWTKLSLERARQRHYESPNEAFAGQSTLVEQVRGRHLAKLLASVVERDIKIQRMKDKIAKREEQLFKLKTLTTTRIKRLESKLSKPNGG